MGDMGNAGTTLMIIGDVGGHHQQFVQLLESVGIDVAASRIPPNLHIVQVGDLIDKGPFSDRVVAQVDALMRANPGRWTQLVGNHDAQLLGQTQFMVEPRTTEMVDTVRRWWSDGLMEVAAAYTTEGVTVRTSGGTRMRVGAGGLLCTHSGLSAGAWALLGSPTDAQEVAAMLNDRARTDATSVSWREGEMITGVPDMAVGPVWASSRELYASWLNADVAPGFHQAHGHSSPFSWRSGWWWPPLGRLLADPRATTHVDEVDRRVRVTFAAPNGTQTLWALDPGHGKAPAPAWTGLQLDALGM